MAWIGRVASMVSLMSHINLTAIYISVRKLSLRRRLVALIQHGFVLSAGRLLLTVALIITTLLVELLVELLHQNMSRLHSLRHW